MLVVVMVVVVVVVVKVVMLVLRMIVALVFVFVVAAASFYACSYKKQDRALPRTPAAFAEKPLLIRRHAIQFHPWEREPKKLNK